MPPTFRTVPATRGPGGRGHHARSQNTWFYGRPAKSLGTTRFGYVSGLHEWTGRVHPLSDLFQGDGQGNGQLTPRKGYLVPSRSKQCGRLGVRIERVERRDAGTATPRGQEHEELLTRRHRREGKRALGNRLPRRSGDLQRSVHLEEDRDLGGWLGIRVGGDDGHRVRGRSEPCDGVVIRREAAPGRTGTGDRRRRPRCGGRRGQNRGRRHYRGRAVRSAARILINDVSRSTRSSQQSDRHTGDGQPQMRSSTRHRRAILGSKGVPAPATLPRRRSCSGLP